MKEEVVEQVLAVDLRKRISKAMLIAQYQLFDLCDGHKGLTRGLFNASKNVQYPLLPRTVFTNILEQSIVLCFGLNDVSA